jgi:hypothetical protein
MPRTITTENPGREVRRYLRHWANVERLDEQVRLRHPGTDAERRRRKARDISASVAQGIELLETASASSLLTKPLSLFYAVEALSKAVCILLDPALEGTSFRTHGLSGIQRRRYFVRTLSCRVNNPGPDVWSRLVANVPADLVPLSMTIDNVPQTNDLRGWLPTPPPRTATELILSDLLRHLPELAEDVAAVQWGHPYAVHAVTYNVRFATVAIAQSATVQIMFRHAHNQETRQMIVDHERPRGHLRGHTRGQDLLDVIGYSAAATTLDEIASAPIRSDIFGEPYMDFCSERIVLAELPIYFAALFILADAVRYQGQWGRLLDDHPDEAVVIDRFLDIATRKVPNLALNELAGAVHLFRVGR